MTRKHGPSNRQFGIGPLDHVQPDGSTGPDEFPGTSGENKFVDEIDEITDVQALIDAALAAYEPAPLPYIRFTSPAVGTGIDSPPTPQNIQFTSVPTNTGGHFTTPGSGPWPGPTIPAGGGLYLHTFSILTLHPTPYEIWTGLSVHLVPGNGGGASRSTATFSYLARWTGSGTLPIAGAYGPADLSGSAVNYSVTRLSDI